MIPIIQKEVIDKHRWVEKEEFINLLAVAQSAPGPMAVNVSIMVGYKIFRTRGFTKTRPSTASSKGCGRPLSR